MFNRLFSEGLPKYSKLSRSVQCEGSHTNNLQSYEWLTQNFFHN